ncbi:hypothetical protein OC846_003459 [Tilletia horrida]|uniref:Elongation of fatty acids protein n=1 Tax=Tilletia horrida TaxID=155126 RepID=A0AAN6GQ38_9BASI|nr:hypothetical protein OC846_003459 [Tilletia horrida]KAK0566023.1 hypothetical protein OC861_003458 [Tilletia horrida]
MALVQTLRGLYWKAQYPLDAFRGQIQTSSSLWPLLSQADLADLRDFPYPPYPTWAAHPSSPWHTHILNTLHPFLPLTFAAAYYLFAKSADNFFIGKAGGYDYTKSSRALRTTIILHNTLLTIFSAWIFVNVAPAAITFLIAGWAGAGWQGFKLAACSIPTNYPHLARYVWFFYVSKYYEVIDSLILVLKGKKIGELQAFHHAGALICMWVAYRYQSQNVWVFTAWNSGVHTLMYMYYVFTAMRWPFPRALKRSLTTLQMLQIASGTIVTNLSLYFTLSPATVVKHGLLPSSPVRRFDSLWSAAYPSPIITAIQRLKQCPTGTGCACIESRGAALSLHINTCYMIPLIALFAQFFIQNYLGGGKSKARAKSEKKKKGAATNGHANGHAKAD